VAPLGGPAGARGWLTVVVVALVVTLAAFQRQVLSVVAPTFREEFALSNMHFAWILSATMWAALIGAPLLGLFIDGVGLRLSAAVAIGFWSLAQAAAALAEGRTGLLVARVAFGLAAAAAIPVAGKAVALYLRPHQRAMGAAFWQTGTALASLVAPLAVVWFSIRFGWRLAFLATGAVGLLAIPVVVFTPRSSPPYGRLPGSFAKLFSWRLLLLAAASALVAALLNLVNVWAPTYFVHTRGLDYLQVGRLFALLSPWTVAGALLGAVPSIVSNRSEKTLHSAHGFTCLGAACVVGLGAALWFFVPGLSYGILGTRVISFGAAAVLVNVYASVLDLAGPKHAAFGVSLLIFVSTLAGAGQSLVVPYLLDRMGWIWVGRAACLVALLLLATAALLKWTGQPAVRSARVN
jgi:ACS family hexuronate transporter-like MFS transporter